MQRTRSRDGRVHLRGVGPAMLDELRRAGASGMRVADRSAWGRCTVSLPLVVAQRLQRTLVLRGCAGDPAALATHRALVRRLEVALSEARADEVRPAVRGTQRRAG